MFKLNKNIFSRISMLLFPLLICGIVQEIYELLSSMITGNGLGNEALAIIGGICISIISTYNNFSNGLRTAGMTIISKKYAANDSDISETIKKTIVLLVLFSLLFSIFMNLFGYQLLKALNVPENILYDTYSYLRIYTIGFIPNTISLMIISTYRAIGEGKRPSLMLCFTYLLNLITDFIVVIILKLNTNYLALSYVFTQTIVAIVLFIPINKDYHLLRKTSKNNSVYYKLLKIGLPIGLSNSLYAVTTMLLNTSINKLGTETVSAYSIFSKIENIFWILSAALGVALTTMFSIYIGSKDFKTLKKSIFPMILLSELMSIIFGVIFYLSSFVFVPLFTENETTIQIAIKAITFMAPLYIFYGPSEVFIALKNSFGKTVIPTILTIIGIAGVRLGWFLFYPDLSSLTTIFTAFPLSWFISTVLFGLYSIHLLKTIEL